MKLNLFGPVTDLGYGVHTRGLAAALEKRHDVDLVLIPLASNMNAQDPLSQAVERMETMDFHAPSICIWHEWNMAGFVGDPRIGFPVFETTDLRPAGRHHLSNTDAIFVPSEWAKTVVLENLRQMTSDDVFVVPEGVDAEIFNPAVEPNPAAKDTIPTFINVGKYEARKGSDILLDVLANRLYNTEVRLLAAWSNPFVPNFDEFIHNELTARGFNRVGHAANRRLYSKGKVIVELTGRIPSHRDLAAIMKAADFAIFPHRGEGWGLPIIESMALGIPTIATKYSGPTEYMNDTNSYAIPSTGLEVAVDNMFFQGDKGLWSTINPDHVEEAMVLALNRPEMMPSNPMQIIKDWNWDRAAEKTVQAVHQITA